MTLIHRRLVGLNRLNRLSEAQKKRLDLLVEGLGRRRLDGIGGFIQL